MITYAYPTNYFTNNAEIKNNFANAVTKGFNTSIYSDVYISGYFYILWTRVPTFLKENVDNLGDFAAMTSRLYKSVEIPAVTLNTVEIVTGFSNTNKVNIPTTLDYDRNLTVTYNELSGLPITRFHQRWISGIRDYSSGVSDIPNYGINTYTGELLYITTKPVHFQQQGSFGQSTGTTPNERMVETAHLFSKIFPTTDNQNLFSGNIEASDKVEQPISYRFAEMFMGQAVNDFAVNNLDRMIKLKDMDAYTINEDGTIIGTI